MAKRNANEIAMRIMGPKQKFTADALATAQLKLNSQRRELQQLLQSRQTFMQENLENQSANKDAKAYAARLAKFDHDIRQKQAGIDRAVNQCEQKRREWVMCTRKMKTVANLHHRQRILESKIN